MTPIEPPERERTRTSRPRPLPRHGATCVSAPGKVLVAGGYLVLDQAYEGLVLATSSRFYTVVRHRHGRGHGHAHGRGNERDRVSAAPDASDAPPGTLGESIGAGTGPSENGHGQSTQGSNADANADEQTHEARITVSAAQFPAGSSWSYLISLRTTATATATATATRPCHSSSSAANSSPTRAPEPAIAGVSVVVPVPVPALEIRQTATRHTREPSAAGRNKFIEVTLVKVLQLAWEAKVAELGIENIWKAGVEEWVRAGQELIADIQGPGAGSGQEKGQEQAQGEGQGLEVYVLADNDFYSQRETLSTLGLSPTLTSLQSLPPFSPLRRPIGETNKTGLGSSAALVTSLTAALLQHLGVVEIPEVSTAPLEGGSGSAGAEAEVSESASLVHAQTESADGAEDGDESKAATATETIHALAQLAHCTAQGKVGSGFDVSSAVYGSHVYRRFDPACISGLMDTDHLPVYPLPLLDAAPSSSPAPAPLAAHTRVPRSLTHALDRGHWDHLTLPLRLPRGLRLVLADVDAGTDTPSFVGKVLKFGKDHPENKARLYAELERANGSVKAAMQAMVQIDRGEGREVANLVKSLDSVRAALRALGEAAGVPIEPPEQTRLLDASCKIPGVLGGGVPGAGGYDALFVIIRDEPSVLAQLQDLWASWQELKVSPLLAMQSDGGLRLERVEGVNGLGDALDGYDARQARAEAEAKA